MMFAACGFERHFVLAQSKPAEWDKIVEAAKKEGKVVASIPPSPELRKTHGARLYPPLRHCH